MILLILYNYFASITKVTKEVSNIHLNIFQTTLRMKVIVQYFCNPLIEKNVLMNVHVLKTAKAVCFQERFKIKLW